MALSYFSSALNVWCSRRKWKQMKHLLLHSDLWCVRKACSLWLDTASRTLPLLYLITSNFLCLSHFSSDLDYKIEWWEWTSLSLDLSCRVFVCHCSVIGFTFPYSFIRLKYFLFLFCYGFFLFIMSMYWIVSKIPFVLVLIFFVLLM